jgi:8-oxo-dGTP pyrophosphatase MutT (NUDIX family)
MLQYAADLTEPFSREQLPAHFTASAAVVDPERGLVCLVDHVKLGRRLQPGGHVEPDDEGPAQAALREVREETGLEPRLHPFAPRPFDVDVHEFPERDGQPAHQHLDLRYLLLAEGEPGPGAHWLGFDEALAAADEPALRRLLEKARRFLLPGE